MFALHPTVKVFSQVFFKKLAGMGRAHKKRRFFLPSFFFAPLVPKKKRSMVYWFLRGENFLERKLFPAPLSKNFQLGNLLFSIISALNDWKAYVRTIPSAKVFSQVFFKKLAGLGGAHKKTAFLFAKLFLCALCAKEKANHSLLIFRRGKKTF